MGFPSGRSNIHFHSWFYFQDNNQVVCQDLNESTLDLSLGLNGHDSDDGSAMKTDQTRKG